MLLTQMAPSKTSFRWKWMTMTISLRQWLLADVLKPKLLWREMMMISCRTGCIRSLSANMKPSCRTNVSKIKRSISRRLKSRHFKRNSKSLSRRKQSRRPRSICLRKRMARRSWSTKKPRIKSTHSISKSANWKTRWLSRMRESKTMSAPSLRTPRRLMSLKEKSVASNKTKARRMPS